MVVSKVGLGGIGLVVGDAVLAVVVQDQVDGDIVRRLKDAAGHIALTQTSDSTPTIGGPFRGILTTPRGGGERILE
jgi:hypothetical protein